MSDRRLAPAAILAALSRLEGELGQADRGRVAALRSLIQPDGRVRLGQVLSALFPQSGREAALTGLRQFRSRLAQAAADASVTFAMEVDSQKRSDPNDRWCWFTGDDSAVDRLSEYARAEALPMTGTTPVLQDAYSPVDVINGKPVVGDGVPTLAQVEAAIAAARRR